MGTVYKFIFSRFSTQLHVVAQKVKRTFSPTYMGFLQAVDDNALTYFTKVSIPAEITLKFRSFTHSSEDTKACANTKAWFRSLIYFIEKNVYYLKICSFDRQDTASWPAGCREHCISTLLCLPWLGGRSG